MNKTIFLSLAFSVAVTISCNNVTQQNNQKEFQIDGKGSGLDRRKSQINKEQNQQQSQTKEPTQTGDSPTKHNEKKRLRYLYYANGGLIGYFDDGTVVGCPKCDFCRTNILAMYNGKPMKSYVALPDGSLLINNSERKIPNHNDDKGWVLIDYKWFEKIPQQ